MIEKIKAQAKLFAVILLVLMIGAGYLGFKSFSLQSDLQTLQQAYSELDSMQRSIVANLEDELTNTQNALAEMENSYRREKRKNDDFEEEYREVINTVYDLDKLSKTDEELLQKYSKVYFLNENYIPSRLSEIDSKLILEGKGEQYFHTNAMKFLEKMFEEAADDNIDLKVVSAYRSFDEQSVIKGQFTNLYGSGANTFSADQGYSEHQLGTTADITVPEVGGTYASFAETQAYKWLQDNAHKYGFTLSYPEGNSYYIFEPWHWRFVGTELASYLYKNDLNFYDLDQRTIDTYLLNIFD